jgi:hypothetical protein
VKNGIAPVAARQRPGALEDRESELVLQVAARAAVPVAEVAGHDERSLLRDGGADALAEPFELEAPAARPQSQVDIDAVHRLLPSVDLDLAMQQAPAFERMVRDVDVLPHRDRVAAHHRVAVVTVLVHGIHAVHAVAALVGEELVLAGHGPRDVAARIRVVLSLHFLQEGHVGLERLQAVADLVQHEAAIELRQPLVDVVRNDVERFPGHSRARFLSGSMRMALRLLHEKTRSAAWSHGSHCDERCSRGATFTASSRGTSSPNTCSVLWVIPGA